MGKPDKIKPDRIKPVRCLLDIRGIPLEFFRHPGDGRKWRVIARKRYGLLLLLSSYADPDGDLGAYSPSERTLLEHYAHGSLYRYQDELRDLGFLTWTRANHHSRRQYRIWLPERARKHVQDSEHIQDSNKKHVPDSQEHVQDSQEHVQPSDVNTSSSYDAHPSFLPSAEPREKGAPDGGASAVTASLSHSDTETRRQEVEFWVAIQESAPDATFSVKDKSVTGAVVARYPLAECIAQARGILGGLDPFELKHAGNRLAANLEVRILARRKAIAEQRRLEAQVAEQVKKDREAAEAEKKARLAEQEAGAELLRDLGLPPDGAEAASASAG